MINYQAYGSKTKLFLLILLTTVVPPLSIDIYSASMPHMLSLGGATISTLQFTVTIYMLAFAIGQIISGYLSDQYGRRVTLISAFPLYLIGTIFCITAGSIHALIIGRVLQGIGAGAIAMTGPAVMGDCFRGRNLVKISSYYAAFGMSPMVTPFIGGILQTYFGWQGNFAFLLIIAIVSYLIFIWQLPETHIITREQRTSAKIVLKSYLSVLTHRRFILPALCTPLIWSTFVIFSIIAPFVMEQKFGYSAEAYGLQTLGIGIGFIIGNLSDSTLIKFFRSKHIIFASLSVMIVMSIVLITLAALQLITPGLFLGIMFIILLGAGLTFPNCYAKALSARPDYAGIQSALIGALMLIGGVMITGIVSSLHLDSLLDMGILYLVMMALTLVISLITFKGATEPAKQKTTESPGLIHPIDSDPP